MHANKTLILTVLATAIAFGGCRKDPEPEELPVHAPVLPSTPYDYAGYVFPEGFIGSFLDLIESVPEDNPITNDGATLGRVLFYDVTLSANYTTSCASCHHQEHGFSDPLEKSVGFDGGETARNSLHLVNHQFSRRMFWDLRANNLESQVLMPIQDSIEMGLTLEELIDRLNSTSYYPSLFAKAFGTSEITTDRVSKALAQFVRSIVSYNTKYDQGIVNDFADFTEQELLGKSIFFNGVTHCNQCHVSRNFHLTSPLNNGLDAITTDPGYGNVSTNPESDGKFKVPSLRNVGLTAPYMHDGRFATLLDVINHYDHDVQPHPYLDDRLTIESQTGGTPYSLNLSEDEKHALVAFLHTLTDYDLINDPKFSDPFPE